MTMTMPFLPTGHTFRNDRFSFAMLDYRRVCMHTCGIPIISGMSGLGFFDGIRHKSPSPHTFWAGIRAPTNVEQYQKFEALNIWTKQTSHGYTWWNWHPKTHAKRPAKQTFQTEEIWNISSMEMRRLWNWILDPNDSCQGKIQNQVQGI